MLFLKLNPRSRLHLSPVLDFIFLLTLRLGTTRGKKDHFITSHAEIVESELCLQVFVTLVKYTSKYSPIRSILASRNTLRRGNGKYGRSCLRKCQRNHGKKINVGAQ